MKDGLIEHAFGDHGDLTIDDGIIYQRAGTAMNGNAMGFLAPLLVATREVPDGVATPFLWESALLVQDIGVLDLPTNRGRDVAVPPKYANLARNLIDPDRLTIHPIELADDQWTYFDGIPVQRADLAIKHLADTPGMEPQWLEAAVTDAFNDALASTEQLARAVDRYARIDHPEPMTGSDLVTLWTHNATVML